MTPPVHSATPSADAWRLLIDEPADGPWNMGVDEALFATAQRSGQATVRFYRWRGPWLSLGYAQRRSTEELAAYRRADVGCVRRVTGGRAVLHGADLTYTVAAPLECLPPGLRRSYSLVAVALVQALATLGVAADRSAPEQAPSDAANFDCFARPAADELCIGGRKFCGSAQRRAHGALLQHGSIRLTPDPGSAVAAIVPGAQLGGTSLLEEGFDVACEALAGAFRRRLETAFDAPLVPGVLSRAEAREASCRGPEPATR